MYGGILSSKHKLHQHYWFVQLQLFGGIQATWCFSLWPYLHWYNCFFCGVFFVGFFLWCLLNTNFSIDINECMTQNPCGANETCTNTAGSYTCSCLPGYAGSSCTGTLSFSLALSISRSLSPSHALSLSPSHALPLALSPSRSLPLAPSLSRALSPSRALSRSISRLALRHSRHSRHSLYER
jgi:Calcium-binding EGF domain